MATRLNPERQGRPGPRLLRAFTLIELLVVIFVVGLLTAILLPAVQSARESARRIQCVANMKQIGLGLQTYYSNYNMFPPSELADRRGVGTNMLSEITFLLPYLEQQPLYAAINIDFALYFFEDVDRPTRENGTARNTRLNILLCPSDGEPNHLNNYRFNRGRLDPGVNRRQPYDGPFSFGVLPTQAVVTDGVSRTAFVSERVAGSFDPSALRPFRDVSGPPQGTMFSSDDGWIKYCETNPPHHWCVLSGRYWLVSGFTTTDYNHNDVPNSPRPSCGPVGTHGKMSAGGLSPPRSFHGNHVGVLFGDGHVESVAGSIDRNVWRALGTFRGGD